MTKRLYHNNIYSINTKTFNYNNKTYNAREFLVLIQSFDNDIVLTYRLFSQFRLSYIDDNFKKINNMLSSLLNNLFVNEYAFINELKELKTLMNNTLWKLNLEKETIEYFLNKHKEEISKKSLKIFNKYLKKIRIMSHAIIVSNNDLKPVKIMIEDRKIDLFNK